MDRLNGSTVDGIAELLRDVRVQSTIYCRSELFEPWGLGLPARNLAVFHLVVSGSAWLEVDGLDEPHRLQAGDLVVLTRGSAHRVRDALDSTIELLEDLLATQPNPERMRFGGRGDRTELLCGGFDLQHADVLPVLSALPPVVHVRGDGRQPPPWLESLVHLLLIELDASAPGADAVVSRLTDVLLAQALRLGLQQAMHDGVPLPTPATDSAVVEALRVVQSEFGGRWTVRDLARRAALSPSAFDARFRRTVGDTPMRYLTRYRLAQAASQLRAGHTLDEVAERVGYGSSVTLSKAFKRYFGEATGAYRKRSRATP
jgi:AraC-like DNA-binding protein